MGANGTIAREIKGLDTSDHIDLCAGLGLPASALLVVFWPVSQNRGQTGQFDSLIN